MCYDLVFKIPGIASVGSPETIVVCKGTLSGSIAQPVADQNHSGGYGCADKPAVIADSLEDTFA